MDMSNLGLSPHELRARLGRMDQIAGIECFAYEDGKARPGRAARVYTGSGLDFTVYLDRCMDISRAFLGGKSLCWRGSAGDVAPQYFEAAGMRWLHSYFGGLLTTCGLGNVGGPAPDSAASGQGLHGRIGNTPAEDVQVMQEWRNGQYHLELRGTMREQVLFGDKLALHRRIAAELGGNTITLEDRLVNEGFEPAPYMLLYHCNLGWPVVDAGSRVAISSRQMAPRDARAAEGMDQWDRLHAPTARYAEKVYFHDVVPEEDGWATVGIANAALRRGDAGGLGAAIRYTRESLPRFTQWTMLGQGDYVVGLEPCTCGVMGREEDEKHGLLHYLAPGEERRFGLHFEAVSSVDRWDALTKSADAQETAPAPNYLAFTPPVSR